MLESTLIDLTQEADERGESPAIIELELSTLSSEPAVQQVDEDGDRPWKCKLCTLAFKYKNNMLEHVRFFHMKGQVPCNYCSQVFPTSKILRKHMQEHSLLAGRCPHCRTTLCKGKSVDKESYTAHLEFCARRPKRRVDSVLHWNDSMSTTNELMSWRCLKCCSTFNEVGNYERHVQVCNHSEVMEGVNQEYFYIRNSLDELVACVPAVEENEHLQPSYFGYTEDLQMSDTQLNMNNSQNKTYETTKNSTDNDIGYAGEFQQVGLLETRLNMGSSQNEAYGETNNNSDTEYTEELQVLAARLSLDNDHNESYDEEINKRPSDSDLPVQAECTDTKLEIIVSEEECMESEEPSKTSEPASADNFAVMYICKYCGKWFTEIEERDNHKLNCTQEKLLESVPTLEKTTNAVIKWLCKYCMKNFSTKEQLHGHKSRCPNRKSKKGLSPLTCKVCNTLFSSEVILKEHLRICIEVQPQSHLTSVTHQRKKNQHDGKKPTKWFCQHCDKFFATVKLALKHKRKCKKNKKKSSISRKPPNQQFQRTIQSTATENEEEEIVDVGSVSEEGAVPLAACNSDLDKTDFVHSLNLHCVYQSKPGFAESGCSNPQVKIEEGTCYEEITTIKRWMCKYCARCFQNRDDLHAHKVECAKDRGNFDVRNLPIHEEERTTVVIRWACKYCGTDFSDKTSLRDHKRKCFWLLKFRAKKARFKDSGKMGQLKHKHNNSTSKEKRRQLTCKPKSKVSKLKNKLDKPRLKKMKDSLKKKLNQSKLQKFQEATEGRNALNTIENIQLRCDCGLYLPDTESFISHRAACGLKKHKGSAGDFRVILKCNQCLTVFDGVDLFREHLAKCDSSPVGNELKKKATVTKHSGRNKMRNVYYCKRCGNAFKGVGSLCKHPCKKMLKHMKSCRVSLENIFSRSLMKKCALNKPFKTLINDVPLSKDCSLTGVVLEVEMNETEDSLSGAVPDVEMNDELSYQSLPLEVVLEEKTNENVNIQPPQIQPVPVYKPVTCYVQRGGTTVTRKISVPTIPLICLGSKASQNKIQARPNVGSTLTLGKTEGRALHIIRLQNSPKLSRSLTMLSNSFSETTAAKEPCKTTLPSISGMPSLLKGSNTQKMPASGNPPQPLQLLKQLLGTVGDKSPSQTMLQCENEMIQCLKPVDNLGTDQPLSYTPVEKMFQCDGYVFDDSTKVICRLCYRSLDSVKDLEVHNTKEHQNSKRPVSLYKMQHAKYTSV